MVSVPREISSQASNLDNRPCLNLRMGQGPRLAAPAGNIVRKSPSRSVASGNQPSEMAPSLTKTSRKVDRETDIPPQLSWEIGVDIHYMYYHHSSRSRCESEEDAAQPGGTRAILVSRGISTACAAGPALSSRARLCAPTGIRASLPSSQTIWMSFFSSVVTGRPITMPDVLPIICARALVFAARVAS
ncbi:hypothetical protein CSOJ01_13367 [Colletotrichum sojae]|uniref:Uncharacterized protein n=1 Tax=Colletotrichum sojae TaxID=2175907 RepID=A0A8H6ITF0_9PEZI|nr:hypothetical protein CSOJ01_13367 [Colletotrichum sojae]